MTTNNPFFTSGARAIQPGWSTNGQETYEQLLALADKIGAACSEAAQQLNAAYAEAYQKLAENTGGFQDGFTHAQQAMLGAITDPTSLTGRLEDTQDRVLALGDGLTELGIEVSLAYLKALEDATLAVAKCQEQVAAASQFDLCRTTATAGAELLRKVATAGAATLREMAS